MQLLRRRDQAVARRILLAEILALAGAPRTAARLIQEMVEACRICRKWARPGPKAVATAKLSTHSNEVVQWGFSFHSTAIVSVLVDEATRFTKAGMVTSSGSVANAIGAAGDASFGLGLCPV